LKSCSTLIISIATLNMNTSSNTSSKQIIRGYLQTRDGKRLGVHIPEDTSKDVQEMEISVNVRPSIWHMIISEEKVVGPQGPYTLTIYRFLLEEQVAGKDFYLDRYCRGYKNGKRVDKVVAFEYWNDRNPAQKWLMESVEDGFLLHSYCRLHEYMKINEEGKPICVRRGEPGDVFQFIEL
jgi:hypothetical protein